MEILILCHHRTFSFKEQETIKHHHSLLFNKNISQFYSKKTVSMTVRVWLLPTMTLEIRIRN